MEQLNLADEERAIEYFESGIKALLEAEAYFGEAAKLTVRYNALSLYWSKEIARERIGIGFKVSGIKAEREEEE